MVTWGSNTVHSIPGTPAPAPSNPGFGSPSPGFGAPAPSPGIFGTSSPAPSSTGFNFGSSTPAPSPGGFGSSAFGSSPAPAPGTSSFFGGTPTPAPSSFFGTPSSGSSLFGNTNSSSIFGSSNTFGQPQQQQQPQQPQIPAQAALHAHQEAMNRVAAEKIKAELAKLHASYSGQITESTSANAKKNFVTILYTDLSQEQLQQQWLHGMGVGGQIMPYAPPKPPHVSEEDWTKAVVKNPDPLSYMPVPLVGAESLRARVTWQQERAQELAKDAELIKGSHETVKDLYAQAERRLEEIRRQHTNHRKRLLNVMRKVEVVRCMNQSLQPDEVRAMEELRKLGHETQQAREVVDELHVQSRSSQPRAAAASVVDIPVPDRDQITKILNEHREKLKKISLTLSEDKRDVDLIRKRVMPQIGAAVHGGSR